MKILRATHLGMCFGVRDAIALALQEAKAKPLTVLGDLVHNETVLNQLRSQGVKTERQVAHVTTSTVVITAHGTSRRTLEDIHQRGFHVLEATCPLVHHAHRVLAGLLTEGFHPVIIGRRDHVEVRGMTDDLDSFDVVIDEDDLAALKPRTKFGVIAQTTQPLERVERLVSALRARFPAAEIRFVDTVCQPTKQRQSAAVELAQRCAVVIVIGGAQSNNTHELAATCRKHCDRVYHVQNADDMRAVWFRQDDTIGLTAGTSTPDVTINEVEAWLRDFAAFQDQLAVQFLAPVVE